MSKKKNWNVVIGTSGIAMMWRGVVPTGYTIINGRLWKHRAKVLVNRWNIPAPIVTMEEAKALLSPSILEML